jgi:hypothetical protein
VEIQLPEDLERFLAEQVEAGRFATKDQVILKALMDFKLASSPGRPPLLGLFSDEPGLMDEVLESAMKDRESRPIRLPNDG